jgi:uncharacterized protein
MLEGQNSTGTAEDQSPSPQFEVATRPSYARTLFFGAEGLRSGWGLAFYVIAFLGLQRAAVDLAWMRDLGASGLWSGLVEEFGSLLAALIPALILSRLERRAWKHYGLPLEGMFGRRFWTGGVWGFAAISVLMLTLFGVHVLSFGHLVLHGARLVRFAGYWTVLFVLVGLFEEFLLRGYLQFTLARETGFWPAALILSCAFGLIHLRNGGEHWPGLLAASFIGLFFCLTLKRTGTLWFAVGFHAAWDWGETFFYSVPDSGMVAPGHLFSSSLRGPEWLSGGSVGPEGSVLCFLIIAGTWVAFEGVYRHRGALPHERGESTVVSSL